MRKIMRKIFTLILISFLSLAVSSQEIADSTFLGKWCGQWDGVYPVCITINSIDENAITRYEWVENVGDDFKFSEKKLKRVNRNTLKLDNVFFAINENDLTTVTVMGVFDVQSRVAILKKIND